MFWKVSHQLRNGLFACRADICLFGRVPGFHRLARGGGFGPVADDGYGVSYMVAGDKTVFFHISSKKDKENTSSKRFAEALSKALEDISALHDLISAREAQIDESNKSK